jgi:hypothetical protein
LGVDLAEAHSVAHEIRPIQRVNVQRVLDQWTAQSNPPAQAFGYSTVGYFADEGLVKYLITDELLAAERGEPSPPLRLTDGDLQDGLRELVYFGGELTQKLLGYRTGRVGFQPTNGDAANA